jgi:hypothetical protein
VGVEVRLLRIEIAGDAGIACSTGCGFEAGCAGGGVGVTGAGGGVCGAGTFGRIEIGGRGGKAAPLPGWGAVGVGAGVGGAAGVGATARIEMVGRGGAGTAGLGAKRGGSDLATNKGGSSAVDWTGDAGLGA